jgi:hypothetical protein
MPADTTVMAPSSKLDREQPERKRTVLIWVIFFYSCLTGVSSFYLVSLWLGWEPIDEAAQIQSLKPDTVQLILSVGESVMSFVAGWAVFNLRARAVYLWLFVVVLTGAYTVYTYGRLYSGGEFNNTFLQLMWPLSLLGVSIPASIFVYVLLLRRQKMLS